MGHDLPDGVFKSTPLSARDVYQAHIAKRGITQQWRCLVELLIGRGQACHCLLRPSKGDLVKLHSAMRSMAIEHVKMRVRDSRRRGREEATIESLRHTVFDFSFPQHMQGCHVPMEPQVHLLALDRRLC